MKNYTKDFGFCASEWRPRVYMWDRSRFWRKQWRKLKKMLHKISVDLGFPAETEHQLCQNLALFVGNKAIDIIEETFMSIKEFSERISDEETKREVIFYIENELSDVVNSTSGLSGDEPNEKACREYVRRMLTPEAFSAIDGLDDTMRDAGLRTIVTMGLYIELKRLKETIPVSTCDAVNT